MSERRPPVLPWRFRMAGELAVMAVCLLGLKWYDAPGWAYILLGYVGTRTARLDSAADLGALQSTIRKLERDDDAPAD